MKPRFGQLFIVGVGRSGTSLVQSMLASHTEIAMMPETGFIRRYLMEPILGRRSSGLGIDGVREDQYLRRWIESGIVETKDLFEKPNLGLDDYQRVSRAYGIAAGVATKYVADKDPKVIETLPHLDKIFTEHRIIHVVRDPRDVILSKRKARWSENQSLLKMLVANRAQVSILETYLSISRERVLEIKYEDLISEPRKTLASICDFLELEFEEGMLNFQEQAAALVSEEELSWKKETFGPLLTKNSSKWKDEMRPKTIHLTEICCNRAMVKGQYEQAKLRIPILQRVTNYILYLGVLILSKVYTYKCLYLTKNIA
jgi:hypothetical protein